MAPEMNPSSGSGLPGPPNIPHPQVPLTTHPIKVFGCLTCGWRVQLREDDPRSRLILGNRCPYCHLKVSPIGDHELPETGAHLVTNSEASPAGAILCPKCEQPLTSRHDGTDAFCLNIHQEDWK